MAGKGFDDFNDGRTAMIAGGLYEHGVSGGGFKYSTGYFSGLSMGDDLNWDVVSYPVLDQTDLVAPASTEYLIGLPRTSKQKENAMQLIRYLTSIDVQKENVKNGIASVRSEDAINKEFGANQFVPKGVHVENFFTGYNEGSFQEIFDTKDIFIGSEMFIAIRNKSGFLESVRQAAEQHLQRIAAFKAELSNGK